MRRVPSSLPVAKSSVENVEVDVDMELSIPVWPFNFLIRSPVSMSNTPACLSCHVSLVTFI